MSEADSDIISMAEDIIDIIVKRGGWEFKSFSHKIFLGKYRNQNALQIQEKLNNIDRTKNSSVLVIVD